MSSGKLRADKTCLNCGHQVEQLFCSHCGQKNVEIKENFVHLVMHFFTDYFHFDSKLLHSYKPLFFKPGFLAKEYLKGKRASYINPIGSLIFLSTLFFITLFVVKPSPILNFDLNNKNGNEDTVITAKNATNQPIVSTPKEGNKLEITGTNMFDNVQKIFNEKDEKGLELLKEKLFHNIPKIMILLIPFIAMFLWLFYWRKKMLYVEHLIFVLFIQCFVYLTLTISLLISKLWAPAFEYSFWIIILYIILSMKRYYGQGWRKTIFKFTLVSICFMILIVGGFLLDLMMVNG